MISLRGLKVGLCILLALVFVLAFAATSSATPEEHLEMLHKAAKAEGEVIFQTMGAASAMDPVVNAFRKRYPDIKVSVVSIGAASIGARLIAEAGAKRISVDLGTVLLYYMMPVIERDLLVQYDWAKNMGVDPNKVTFGNRLVDYTHAPRIWIYNTKLVPKADVPKTWEDVLDPKWKGGKIAVRAAPTGFNWLWPEWKKDKEKVITFVKRFAGQDVLPGKRDATMVNQVATGECPIGVVTASNVLRAIEKGAPIAVKSMGPTASDAGAFYMPKGGPHPNAGKLFMAWAIGTKEGTDALLEAGYGPAFPPEAGDMAKLLGDNGVGFVPVNTAEDIKEYSGVFADTVMKIMNFMPE